MKSIYYYFPTFATLVGGTRHRGDVCVCVFMRQPRQVNQNRENKPPFAVLEHAIQQ